MSVRTPIIGLVLLSVGSAAQADWQYTKWGASPEQVIAASKGTVSAFDPSKDAEMPYGVKEAGGTFTSKERVLKASFWFKERKLTQVHLTSNDQSDCVSLSSDLNGIYGEPQDRPTGRSMVWNDSKGGNRIQLIDWGAQGCDLNYSQIATSAATGL